jgi:hypothetical protein
MIKNYFLLLVVYFLTLNVSAQNWTEIAKTLPQPYLHDWQYSGQSVAIDGEYAVIGANGYESRTGIAYILHYDGTEWIVEGELSASDGHTSDDFGHAVSISGDVIVIGAYGSDVLASTSGSAYIFSKPASGWTNMTQTAKIHASDGEAGVWFGISVDISGDNIIIGARLDAVSGDDSGSAYLFSKPAGGWKDTTETLKILPSNGAEDDEFGYSVSIDGETIAVGCRYDDDNGPNSGAVYVYTKSDTGWIGNSETAKLLPSDGSSYDYFGHSVSIWQDNIVVGANTQGVFGEEKGKAYIFTKPESGWTNMTETAMISPSDPVVDGDFGWSVSMYNDVVAIGSPGSSKSGIKHGAIYVYSKPTLGWENMTETIKMVPTGGSEDDKFGTSVAIYGHDVLVGAIYNDEGSDNGGASYFFTKQSDKPWYWLTQTKKILPTKYAGNSLNYYGSSVSLDSNTAVIGSYGHSNQTGIAYVVEYNGTDWITTAQLSASDGEIYDKFGGNVSISGDDIVIGANSDDDNGTFSGSAYVYSKPVGGWVNMTETAKLLPSDGVARHDFGESVSICGDNIVIGADNDHETAEDAGAAYVFTKPITGWINTTETAKLLASDGTTGDHFGNVSISKDNIVVTATFDDQDGSYSGSAYVFTKPSGGWKDTTENAKLLPSDGATYKYFGGTVSIFENDIVIGAAGDSENASSSGAAYIFTMPVGGWSSMNETAKISASDPAASDNFGSSVSIHEDLVAVGAYRDDDNGTNSGSVYTYKKPATGWVNTTETIKTIANGGAVNDAFGTVCLSSSGLLIGANGANGSGEKSGVAYFFKDDKLTNNESIDDQDNYEIYPNPVQDILIIESTKNIELIKIFNSLGALEKVVKSNFGNIDVSQLASGTHFIRIITNEGISSSLFQK